MARCIGDITRRGWRIQGLGANSACGPLLVYPGNITLRLGICEVSLPKGKMYTILTSKSTKAGKKQCLVAIINGTDAHIILEVPGKDPAGKA
jgi:hypothetical protein